MLPRLLPAPRRAGWSPVIINTRMPAGCACRIAADTSGGRIPEQSEAQEHKFPWRSAVLGRCVVLVNGSCAVARWW